MNPISVPELTVTAVVPLYNRARLIERCIRSIKSQTVPPHEIIVVDDGSSDDGADIAALVPGVTVLRKDNGGAGSARSAGLAAAGSTWVAFLDSDDEWEPDHLERITSAIAATAGRAHLYFDDTTRSPSEGGGSHWARCRFAPDAEYVIIEDGAAWMMLPMHPPMLQSSVVRRTTAEDIGGFRRGLYSRDDTDFFFRLGIGRPICAVKGVGAVMSDDADQRLGERSARKSTNYWVASERMYQPLLEHPWLGPSDLRIVRRRLADSRIRLAAMRWREGDPVAAATSALRAFRVDARSTAAALTVSARTRIMRN